MRKTSTGVYVDRGEAERAPKPPRPQNKPKKIYRMTRKRREKLMSTALVVFVLASSVLFSLCFGEKILEGEASVVEAALMTQATTAEPTQTPLPSENDIIVYVSASGTRYHGVPDCSGMKEPREMALKSAAGEGYTACKRCNPPEI